MMNVLALSLVLTSLLTAGFFTPSPEKEKTLKDDVIVKEGHRVVVVEYEKDDGNTKVSISPPDSQTISHKVDHEKGFVDNAKDRLSEKMEDVKERMKEASSSFLPEVGKVGNQEEEEEEEEEVRHGFSPKELVCDAYGRCKDKIASAMGKTKEAAEEKAHTAADRVYESGKEAIGKAKETVTQTTQKASDKIQETKENVKDSASEAIEKIKGNQEKVMEKAKEAENLVENASDRARYGVKKGEKELSEILGQAKEVIVDVFDYMVPSERLDSITGLLHLMGFASAYGMCLWVTFVSSYVLAGALPRHQFAMVQSKIYPVYFKAMAYSVGMAMLGHLMSRRKSSSIFSVGMFQGFNLMASLAMILVNLMFLEPRATKVMLERMKKEKEEGKGKEGHSVEPSSQVEDSIIAETAGRGTRRERPEEGLAPKSQIIGLSETLQRLNSYSSLLNVLTLVSLTWHLVYLGQCVHAVC